MDLPLAAGTGHCAETGLANTTKQNSVGKMVFMGKSTGVHYCVEGFTQFTT